MLERRRVGLGEEQADEIDERAPAPERPSDVARQQRRTQRGKGGGSICAAARTAPSAP